jgi:HPt (histidine-containing phosphotransfer) domain-containing protein
MKTNTDAAARIEAVENQTPINLDGFREAACGEESERIEVLKLYAGQLKLRLPQAQAALGKTELHEVARVLHSLTGATFTCGLNEFGAALRDLELSAKNGDAAAAIAQLPAVNDYARRVDAAIASELARCSS